MKPIVRDESIWDPTPSDNIFPYKSLGIHISDICQRLNFNPFGEVIGANQQPPPISYCFSEGAHNIHAPLCKGLGAGQRVENNHWLMDILGVSLTLVILFHIFLCFFLHIRPAIPLGEGFVRQ